MAALGISIALPACDGGGDGGYDGPYGGYYNNCIEAVDAVRSAGCSADSARCLDEASWLENTEGACLEQMVGWNDCLITSTITSCSLPCDPNPTVICQTGYCENVSTDPNCCSQPGGPGCPPTW